MDRNSDAGKSGGMTVTRLLIYAADRYKTKTCIDYRRSDKEIVRTYEDILRDSLAFCAFFSRSFPRGSHIALLGRTSYNYLCCLNGIIMADCVAVPLSEKMTEEETARLLRDSDSVYLVYNSLTADMAKAVMPLCPLIGGSLDLSDRPVVKNIFTGISDGAGPDSLLTREQPDSPAVMIYTSGTTGDRKGAVLTSEALISNVFFKEMSFEGEHVALNVLPMYHIFSFSCDYLKNLKDGVKICLCPDIPHLAGDLLYFEPTMLRLVPMIADSLLRKVRIIRNRDPSLSPRAAAEKVFGSRLRHIIVSGAAYSASNDREFTEMGITIRQGYGMTETGPRIAVPDGKTCAASGGRIISICDVRIENGEIQVRSPSLMSGYYKRPEETAAVFTQDGWFRTGDLGRISEDGELFITGRLKNTIILPNGENVSPEEIEMKYVSDPLVSEIEVYEKDGKIYADIFPDLNYVRANRITDAEARIETLVRQTNASDRAEKEIDVVNVVYKPLPKTETGKLKRRSVKNRE